MEEESKTQETLLENARLSIERIRTKAKVISGELEEIRRGKVFSFASRLKPPRDLRTDIAPAFQQLYDDSIIFYKDIKGFRLQSSLSLHGIPYLQYSLRPRRDALSGVLLAFILDVPLKQGEAGIEIVSNKGGIHHHCRVPIGSVDPIRPTKFAFSPIEGTEQEDLWLRVFVSGVDTPVRLFEWQEYRLWGLGRLQRKAFCGLVFDE